ncbi:hypothetical protein FHR22_002404 [Sphingopyxis panaciterrae]|nr:integrase arm-type DNA-binding domain-containing protein [Sphingopyxis panaciterrae]NIJ37720.1 hypothetical protein [Sphingopyxis panaciterrae]
MLTNVTLKALKPEGKPYKKPDGGGLFILVEMNGSKLWRFVCRYDGKQKLLSGGGYPDTSLVVARAWREKMKHQLALGLDPSIERAKETAKPEAGTTFEEIAREWLAARKLAWVPKYASHITRRLEGDMFPAVGDLDNQPDGGLKRHDGKRESSCSRSSSDRLRSIFQRHGRLVTGC